MTKEIQQPKYIAICQVHNSKHRILHFINKEKKCIIAISKQQKTLRFNRSHIKFDEIINHGNITLFKIPDNLETQAQNVMNFFCEIKEECENNKSGPPKAKVLKNLTPNELTKINDALSKKYDKDTALTASQTKEAGKYSDKVIDYFYLYEMAFHSIIRTTCMDFCHKIAAAAIDDSIYNHTAKNFMQRKGKLGNCNDYKDLRDNSDIPVIELVAEKAKFPKIILIALSFNLLLLPAAITLNILYYTDNKLTFYIANPIIFLSFSIILIWYIKEIKNINAKISNIQKEEASRTTSKNLSEKNPPCNITQGPSKKVCLKDHKSLNL